MDYLVFGLVAIWGMVFWFGGRYLLKMYNMDEKIAQPDETEANDSSVSESTTRLVEMSDSELLRKIAKHSEESAFVLKRFLFVAQVFAALWFIGMIIQFIQAAN